MKAQDKAAYIIYRLEKAKDAQRDDVEPLLTKTTEFIAVIENLLKNI